MFKHLNLLCGVGRKLTVLGHSTDWLNPCHAKPMFMSCLCKHCRCRSVGFWRSHLHCLSFSMWIYISNFDQVKSDWLEIRGGCGILIYSAWQGLKESKQGLAQSIEHPTVASFKYDVMVTIMKLCLYGALPEFSNLCHLWANSADDKLSILLLRRQFVWIVRAYFLRFFFFFSKCCWTFYPAYRAVR